MKVFVAVKRVLDYNVKVRIKPDHSGVDLNNVKMSMNPFDEIAVEAAVQLKEKGIASEVVLATIGPKASQETLRNGLALGADRALHIEHDIELEPLNIAKILKQVILDEVPQLVIMGKQAIDGDNNQVGQMLAGLLGWPQATFASEMDIENNQAKVTREIDGGLETLNLQLPAIVTTDLRLNEPRYASLPNIMKAKKKPLDVKTVEELGVQTNQHLEILSVEPPPQRTAGIRVHSVDELLDKLKNDAKVIS